MANLKEFMLLKKAFLMRLLKETKEEIVNIYHEPKSFITPEKAGRWAVIQLVKAFLGMPISYGLLNATKYGFQGFGELWPIRLLAFAVGMISFPIITYFILGEGITIKTGFSIVLAVIIMLIQLI